LSFLVVGIIVRKLFGLMNCPGFQGNCVACKSG